MKQLIQQIRWQYLILHRNNLIYVSIAITVIYALILFGLKTAPNMDKVLVLLLFNDPALIGLIFIGLSVIMEKNQMVFSAIFVSPINHHLYLISRVLALSILGLLCAIFMSITTLGFSINWLHFSMGIFCTCIIFSIAGIVVVCFTTDFLKFLLQAVPIMLILSLPLLNFFEVTNVKAFSFLPTQACLNLIDYSYQKNLSLSFQDLLLNYLQLLLWIPALYYLSFRLFILKIITI